MFLCHHAVWATRAEVDAVRWSACRNQRESAKASAIPPPPQVRAVRPTAARVRPERSHAEQSTRKASLRRSAAAKHYAAWASQSAISTGSACFPRSRSCTLQACELPRYSVQVSSRRHGNPRQVAAVAKGRRLTLPSSGQSKGCALRLPLMSNVRRRKESRVSRAVHRQDSHSVHWNHDRKHPKTGAATKRPEVFGRRSTA